MTIDLRTKRIYEPAAPEDGARILIDRIWPRGVARKEAKLTSWNKDIAPSTGLRKWFGHDPARWAEFRKRYRMELKGNARAVHELTGLMQAGPVTLLYAAHDVAHNHAIVLADYLRDQMESRHGRRPA